MDKVRSERRWRAIFVSDLHVGSRWFDARGFLAFLAAHPTDALYLVGDTFDLWSVARRPFWSHDHHLVVKALSSLLRSGTRIVVLTGNHDRDLLGFAGTPIDGLEICDHCIHTAADGRCYLVVHGDLDDPLAHRTRSLGPIAAAWKERLAPLRALTTASLRIRVAGVGTAAGAWVAVRRTLGGVATLEAAIAARVAALGLDGVICGHTHVPADKVVGAVRYLNCGDWVGSASAVRETADGALQLIGHRPRSAPTGWSEAAAERPETVVASGRTDWGPPWNIT